MTKFKSGDKVTLNCSVQEFKSNVGCGKLILDENFSTDLIATVHGVHKHRIELSEVVSCSGVGSIDIEELQYLKLVEEIKPVGVQPKIIQLLSYDNNLLGLGDDGIIYVNESSEWEVYSYAVF